MNDVRASRISQLGSKAIACLEMARLLHRPISDHEAYEAAYADACRLYSEKAVLAKFRELVDRGYLECGRIGSDGVADRKRSPCVGEQGVKG